MRRRRHRKSRSAPAGTPQDTSAAGLPDHPLLEDAPRALFDDDVASQRLFNRAVLDQMGDYSAVILASDSLRPAWAEPGDLVHVRRGAEDAKAIKTAVSNQKTDSRIDRKARGS